MKKLVLCLVVLCSLQACTKGNTVGCAIEGTLTTAVGSAVTKELQCVDGAAVTADIQAQVAKLGLCKQAATVATLSVGSTLCEGLTSSLIAGAATAGIPANWGCQATNAKDLLSAAAKAGCAKVFP